MALVLLGVGWLLLSGPNDGNTPFEFGKSHLAFNWRKAMVRRGTEELRRDERGLLHRFGFMRGRSKVVPQKTRRAITVSIGRASALRLHFNRALLLPTATGIGIWVIEGNGVTCISSAKDGSTACDTSLDAWRKGLLLETYRLRASVRDRPTDFVALGVVPNWANAIEISINNTNRIVRVHRGAYGLRARTSIKVMRVIH